MLLKESAHTVHHVGHSTLIPGELLFSISSWFFPLIFENCFPSWRVLYLVTSCVISKASFSSLLLFKASLAARLMECP